MKLESFLDGTSDLCDIVEYVEAHVSFPAFYDEVSELSDYHKSILIHDLLASDYNIFVPWYKKLLIECSKSTTDRRLAGKSLEILNYYADRFSKVN